MSSSSSFISCDWGTSSFRLRWVSNRPDEVIHEIRTTVGTKNLYDHSAGVGIHDASARAQTFADYLEAQLLSWKGEADSPIPLVVSGMASSSVGWKELPYSKVPFRLSAADIVFDQLHWNAPGIVSKTFLLSGVQTAVDIMRGEETETVGIMTLPEVAAWRDECLVVLPGTHAKHITIQNGAIADFRTYMTGELLSVLASHSLLKATTDLRSLTGPFTGEAESAFNAGIQCAHEIGLSASLFRTRSRAVLNQISPVANTWFLSGVLIGSETHDLASSGRRIVIGGPPSLVDLYQVALAKAGQPASYTKALPPMLTDRAALLGHRVFLEMHASS